MEVTGNTSSNFGKTSGKSATAGGAVADFPHVQTVGEAKLHRKQESIKGFRSLVTGAATTIGSTTAMLAFVTNLIGLGKTSIGEAINKLSNKAAAGTFGTYGTIAAIDAAQRNDHKMTVPQMLAVLIPSVFTRNYGNLTLNRGLDVGLTNVSAEVEKLTGERNYSNHTASFNAFWKALKLLGKELASNPVKALTDFQSGIAGMFWGLVTAVSPGVFKLTGSRQVSTVLRQAGGLIAEGGKLSLDNIKNKRTNYFLSGLLLSGSSTANMLGAFVSDRYRIALENLTWVLNMVGKNLQIEAINSGELNRHGGNTSLSDFWSGLFGSNNTAQTQSTAAVDVINKDKVIEAKVDNAPQAKPVVQLRNNVDGKQRIVLPRAQVNGYRRKEKYIPTPKPEAKLRDALPSNRPPQTKERKTHAYKFDRPAPERSRPKPLKKLKRQKEKIN